MTKWRLEKEYIAPEMSGLPGKGRITGPIDQINRIMGAIMSGDLDRIEEQVKQIATLKAALIEKQYRLMPTAPSCYNDARREAAIEQLACELPEIFGEGIV